MCLIISGYKPGPRIIPVCSDRHGGDSFNPGKSWELLYKGIFVLNNFLNSYTDV